jgi:hypothetical protein
LSRPCTASWQHQAVLHRACHSIKHTHKRGEEKGRKKEGREEKGKEREEGKRKWDVLRVIHYVPAEGCTYQSLGVFPTHLLAQYHNLISLL